MLAHNATPGFFCGSKVDFRLAARAAAFDSQISDELRASLTSAFALLDESSTNRLVRTLVDEAATDAPKAIELAERAARFPSATRDALIRGLEDDYLRSFLWEDVIGDATSVGREIRMRSTTNPDWGVTRQHVRKHFVGTRSGDEPFAMAGIDPGGDFEKWRGHFIELSQRPITGTTADAVDVVGLFDLADGTGTFRFGIRLSRNSDGTFDLITFLTSQP